MSKNGGPAFPTIGNIAHNADWVAEDGMTLRDWFAGNVAAAAMTSATGLGSLTKEERAAAFASVASISYEFADAMLAARSVE